MIQLEELTRKIVAGDPFSFVKFGDAEWICMSGIWGQADASDCSKYLQSMDHLYGVELGQRLCDAYRFFCRSERSLVGVTQRKNLPESAMHVYDELTKLGNQPNIDVETLLPTMGVLASSEKSERLQAFYAAVRRSDRRKVYIGPDRLHEAADVLRVEHVVIPLENAFNEYDWLREKVTGLDDGAILGISAGMPAKVLIHDATASARGVTCLDLGSAFDSLCGFHTRSCYPESPVTSRQFFSKVAA
jgi:hypothetical protein